MSNELASRIKELDDLLKDNKFPSGLREELCELVYQQAEPSCSRPPKEARADAEELVNVLSAAAFPYSRGFRRAAYCNNLESAIIDSLRDEFDREIPYMRFLNLGSDMYYRHLRLRLSMLRVDDPPVDGLPESLSRLSEQFANPEPRCAHNSRECTALAAEIVNAYRVHRKLNNNKGKSQRIQS